VTTAREIAALTIERLAQEGMMNAVADAYAGR